MEHVVCSRSRPIHHTNSSWVMSRKAHLFKFTRVTVNMHSACYDSDFHNSLAIWCQLTRKVAVDTLWFRFLRPST